MFIYLNEQIISSLFCFSYTVIGASILAVCCNATDNNDSQYEIIATPVNIIVDKPPIYTKY
jgi:hypothetical protein